MGDSHIHTADLHIDEKTDLTGLMNWSYNREPYCDFTKNFPVIFSPIMCYKSEITCPNCYTVIIPLSIKNKPWGIMGLSSYRKRPCSKTVMEAIVHLAHMVGYLIKISERNKTFLTMIDTRLTEVSKIIKD